MTIRYYLETIGVYSPAHMTAEPNMEERWTIVGHKLPWTKFTQLIPLFSTCSASLNFSALRLFSALAMARSWHFDFAVGQDGTEKANQKKSWVFSQEFKHWTLIETSEATNLWAFSSFNFRVERVPPHSSRIYKGPMAVRFWYLKMSRVVSFQCMRVDSGTVLHALFLRIFLLGWATNHGWWTAANCSAFVFGPWLLQLNNVSLAAVPMSKIHLDKHVVQIWRNMVSWTWTAAWRCDSGCLHGIGFLKFVPLSVKQSGWWVDECASRKHPYDIVS